MALKGKEHGEGDVEETILRRGGDNGNGCYERACFN